MKIGYVRVSSIEPNQQIQVEALEKYGVERIYIDNCSGKNAERPEFQKMMNFVREDDVIIIYDFSRIGKNLKSLLNLIDDLEQNKINLISLNEKLDCSTSSGKSMISIMGMINDFERAVLKEYQMQGIELAKKRGVYTGRKAIKYPENWEEYFIKWKNREISATQAMNEMGLKRTTYYKLLKEYTKELNDTKEKDTEE